MKVFKSALMWAGGLGFTGLAVWFAYRMGYLD